MFPHVNVVRKIICEESERPFKTPMNRDPRLDPRTKSTSLGLNQLIPLISKSQKDGPVVSSTHTSRPLSNPPLSNPTLSTGLNDSGKIHKVLKTIVSDLKKGPKRNSASFNINQQVTQISKSLSDI